MSIEEQVRRWQNAPPGRLVNRGHQAGDFLEAYDWSLQERKPGYLKIEAHLPDHVKNPRGQLFGGFTPTYVDFVALFTVRSAEPEDTPRDWLATTNMRIDYLEPVVGPLFLMESTLIKGRKRMCFIETRFLDLDSNILVFALTTIRKMPRASAQGDA